MNQSGPAATHIKPTDLRGILKYVPRFQGQIFVIALDGAIVADDNLSNLLLDIAVLRSLQIRVVLAHGIGHQLKQLAAEQGIELSDVDGAGLTDLTTRDLAVRASSRVSHQILEGLTQSGLKCAITNSVRATPVGIVKGVDQQHSGRVEKIDTEFIINLLNQQIVPIVQPVGFDRSGHTLRINSDLLATSIAAELQATKIIFLSARPGLEIDGEVRRQISMDDLSAILESRPDSIERAQHSKARQAVRAIGAGIPRVHIIDGRLHDALLNEIFSNEGVGTLIHGNEYQQIRKATKRDIRLIHNLTRHAVKRAELVHRTLEAVERNIDSIYVFEIDENLIGCVSLTTYPDKPGTVEIGSLYVQPFHSRQGIGQKLVEFACMAARNAGATEVIALSTQAFSFFTDVCGFSEAGVDVLPESRRKLYEQSQRNSKILARRL